MSGMKVESDRMNIKSLYQIYSLSIMNILDFVISVIFPLLMISLIQLSKANESTTGPLFSLGCSVSDRKKRQHNGRRTTECHETDNNRGMKIDWSIRESGHGD